MGPARSHPARAAALGALIALAGCGQPPPDAAPPAPPRPAPPAEIRFIEVAAELGIDFVHGNGAFGMKWLPETMGSGCAWWDHDGDGDPDALLLSGRDWPGHPTGGRQRIGLYRNDAGRFTDVTAQAGLDVPIYAMGATAGDYDADGDSDLFVTAVGPHRLFRNDGGRFTDVAAQQGVALSRFGSSAAWLDHDKDGDLDLFVLGYVEWTPGTDLACSLDGRTKSYCTPESYQGASPALFRNDGGSFTDVSVASRIRDGAAKGLGIAVLDHDGDGWDDVFVANDTQPNFLYRAQGDGTFTEQGVLADVAFDGAGHARGGMGADAGDFDHSGRPGLVIGNFSNEMVSLYRNLGAGRFADVAPESAVGQDSLRTLAFGTLFLDFDLDGFLDIFVANGHVEPDIGAIQPGLAHAQAPHLFRNLGGGRFEDVAPASPALSAPMVARGAATADFDGDGDLDILVNTVAGHARLFRNDGADGRRALRVRLVGGAGSSRDAYGARVRVIAGTLAQVGWLRSGHSYGSQSENVLTFGLGEARTADEVEVGWPSGKRSVVRDVPAGSTITLREAEAR